MPSLTLLTSADPPAPLKPVPPSNPFLKNADSLKDAMLERPGFAVERATLDEGAVVLQWPEKLSPESVRDLEYWINGVLRRAKRKAGLSQDSVKEIPEVTNAGT